MTDTNGYYTMAVPAGPCSLEADPYFLQPMGYLGLLGAVPPVNAAQAAAASFSVQPATATVTGCAVDAQTADPLWTQDIQIVDDAGDFGLDVTLSDGTFNLGVQGGTWRLYAPQFPVYGASFASYVDPVVVPDGGTVTNVSIATQAPDSMLVVQFLNSRGEEADIPGVEIWATATIKGASINNLYNQSCVFG
jgi:hypothetical protein